MNSKIYKYSFFLFTVLLATACDIQPKVEIKDIKISVLDSPTTKAPIRPAIAVDTTQFYPVNSKDKLQAVYDSTARFMWRTFVPEEGQAKTIQGELIRSIERLDYEIGGNAKNNWTNQYIILGTELREYLISSNTFPHEIEKEITNDINVLTRNPEEVYTDDDVYDRLRRRIVEWYWRHPTPINRKQNPRLKI